MSDYSWMSPDEAIERLRGWMDSHIDEANESGTIDPCGERYAPHQNEGFSHALDYVAYRRAIKALDEENDIRMRLNARDDETTVQAATRRLEEYGAACRDLRALRKKWDPNGTD